jgi:hypothetical protein
MDPMVQKGGKSIMIGMGPTKLQREAHVATLWVIEFAALRTLEQHQKSKLE